MKKDKQKEFMKFMSVGTTMVTTVVAFKDPRLFTAFIAYSAMMNMINLHLEVGRLRRRYFRKHGGIKLILDAHLRPWEMVSDYLLHKKVAKQAVERLPELKETLPNMSKPKHYWLAIEDLEEIRDTGDLKKQ